MESPQTWLSTTRLPCYFLCMTGPLPAQQDRAVPPMMALNKNYWTATTTKVSPSSSSWAKCFLGSFWSACSLHNGGIWKVIIHSRLKNGTHFPCFESLPKGYFICSKWVYASLSHEILRQTMFGDKVLWYTQISVIITTIFSDKYQLNTFFGQFSVNY